MPVTIPGVPVALPITVNGPDDKPSSGVCVREGNLAISQSLRPFILLLKLVLFIQALTTCSFLVIFYLFISVIICCCWLF